MTLPSKEPGFRFAVTAAQWALPGAPVLLRCETSEQFLQAKALGYDAIELHLRSPEDVPARLLCQQIEKTGVAVSAVATGLSKLVDGLCFIDPDAAVRQAAVERIFGFIDWAAQVGCGIVIGSLRGNLPREPEARALAEGWMREAMARIADRAGRKAVEIYLEVINRYENNYLNTAAETVAYVRSFQNPFLKVHLDTFHMNIEEASMVQAIRETGGSLGYFHLADNNRHACGEGSLDFGAILAALDGIGYRGYASVECLCIPDGVSAARNSLAHLRAVHNV